jgi:hypothetical protein
MKRASLGIAVGLQVLTGGCQSLSEVPHRGQSLETKALFDRPSASTLTLSTNGGSKIDALVVSFPGKTRWSLFFQNSKPIESAVNSLMEQDGYDVSHPMFLKLKDGTEIMNSNSWIIETTFLGDPRRYVVYDSSAEGQAIAQEKLTRGIGSFIIGAFEMGVLRSTPHLGISHSSYLNSQHYRNAEYLTSDMLDGLPLGGRKAVVNRVYNVFHKALQEAITIAYEDISDEDLIRINGRFLVSLLKVKGAPEFSDELWKGTPYNNGNQHTYVTGKIPPTEIWRDGVVTNLREVAVGSSIPSDAALAPGIVVRKDVSEGKLLTANAYELTYKLDGETTESKLIAEKYRVRRLDVGDRISLQAGLFGTSIKKAK